MTLQCDLNWSLPLSLTILSLTWWFHLFIFLYTNNHNVKWGREKWDWQQLRNFKHKGKRKIGCYPKYILIFYACQVHVWCSMILILVNTQPDGRNIKEIILNRSWHKHLKSFKTYTFILKKLKNHPDGFSTHIFFSSKIILNSVEYFHIGYIGY